MSTQVNSAGAEPASGSPKKRAPRTPKKVLDKIAEANSIVEANSRRDERDARDEAERNSRADAAAAEGMSKVVGDGDAGDATAPKGWVPLLDPAGAEAAGAVLAAAGAINGSDLRAGWAPGYTEQDFQTTGVRAADFMRGRGPVPEQPVSELWDNSAQRALEKLLWNLTPGLQMVALDADSLGIGRLCLLAAILPRLAQTIPWFVRLPDGFGRMGHGGIAVNWFTALTAVAGTGKTATVEEAERLIPIPRGLEVLEKPEGTGEGIVKMFTHTAVKKDKENLDAHGMPTEERVSKITRRHGHMYADEVNAIEAELSQSRSKLAPTLRKAYYGKMLGTTAGGIDSDTELRDLAYRFTLLMCVQPEFAASFFADIAGGTPQRFFWILIERSRKDLSIGTVPPIKVTEWGMPKPSADTKWAPTSTSPIMAASDPIWIDWAPACRAEMEAAWASEDWDRSPIDIGNGEDDEFEKSLSQHRETSLQKLALLLAVLDGLREVSDVHWEAAKILHDIRDLHMRIIRETAELAGQQRRESEGSKRGQVQGAANLAAKAHGATVLFEVEQRLVTLLRKKPQTEGMLRTQITASRRGAVSDALADLTQRGFATFNATSGEYAAVK